MDIERIELCLCKQGVSVHDTDIYLEDGWKIHDADPFINVSGYVVAKQDLVRPEWLDFILPAINNPIDKKRIQEAQNKIVRGFWILSICNRTVVACFGESYSLLDHQKLETQKRHAIEIPSSKIQAKLPRIITDWVIQTI